MKVCLVSHGHPAANPRLVREADALHTAGYDVVVITPQFVPRLVPFDREIIDAAGWRYLSVDFLGERRGEWSFVRARRRVAATLAPLVPMESVVRRACNYANPEIARLAAGEKADLYVAHQHHALPAAAGAASRAGSRFGFDAEDLLADSTAEPRNLIRSIEQRYLPGCAYVSTMSEPAARRLHATNRLHAPIAVLHNTPSVKERGALDPPDRRRQSGIPSIYWFGQTLGPHSCAEQLLRALPLLERPVQVVLRGAAHGGYAQHLERIAAELDVSGQLTILPLAPPARMVGLAGEHDILLGSQPGHEMFHQLAVGNKVFTGMMAGLALALTDTIAHRHLLGQAPGCGFLFPDRDEKRLAEELNSLIAQPARLAAMKQRSWECAQREFNWEVQARRYLSLVEGAIAGACV